jgi:hypothetical protein
MLARADRRAALDHDYKRPDLKADEVQSIKSKWRLKQVRKYSEAASVFGPRESQRDVFECIEMWRAEQRSRNQAEKSSSVDEPASSSAPQQPSASQSSLPACLDESLDGKKTKSGVVRKIRKLASKFSRLFHGSSSKSVLHHSENGSISSFQFDQGILAST